MRRIVALALGAVLLVLGMLFIVPAESIAITAVELDQKIEQVIRRVRGTPQETIIPYLRCLQEQNWILDALEHERAHPGHSARCAKLLKDIGKGQGHGR